MAHRKVNKHFYVISTAQKKKWSEYDYEFYVDASFRKFQQPGHELCTYSAYSFLIIDGNGIKNIFLSEKFSNIIKSAGKAELVGIYNVIQYIRKNKKRFKGKNIPTFINSIKNKILVTYPSSKKYIRNLRPLRTNNEDDDVIIVQ